MLAEVDEHWGTTPLATLEPGFGRFATDRRVLLLCHVHARARLGFYSLEGMLQGTLALSPKRVMGRVRDFFMTCDLCADHLWLGDWYGAVTCCAAVPR